VTSPALPRIVTVLGLMAVCLGAATTDNSCSIRDFLKGNGSNDNQSFVTQLALINANQQETDTFDFGERITMQLTVRNTSSDNTAEVQFPTTRTSDFVVVDPNSNAVLWKWSTSQPAFAATPTALTFQPGETKTFTVTWNQVGDNGAAVNPGTYEARGVLVYDDFDLSPLESNNLGSSPTQFTISRP
jgi:archaellum component FlaG (FlaF/FlaG flagellin family)